MKRHKITMILFFNLVSFLCVSQKKYDYENHCLPGDTIADKRSKMKFIIGSSQRSVMALDFNDKILWQTNPWDSEFFRTYDRSMSDSFSINHIISIFLRYTKKKSDPYIYLRFENSPIAAVIERKTGRFQLLGVM